MIIKNRVSGQLAVTRALGDLELKNEGVSIVPDVNEFELSGNLEYIVVASDGLWDTIED